MAGPVGFQVQRVSTAVNNIHIGEVICRGRQHYEFFVPRDLIQADRPVRIAFELPNACRPCDFGINDDERFLALRVARIIFAPVSNPSATSLNVDADVASARREALRNIQSLGINCELGFLQRQVGAEPLGLFRWTFTPLQKLIHALERGLEGLGSPGSLQVHVDANSEFIVRDTIYGFQYHSFVHQSQDGTAERVLHNEYIRLQYLSRNLMEDLRESNRLFAYHDAGESSLEDIRRLVKVMNDPGKNTLLWIVPAPESSVISTARVLESGLLQAFVAGFQLPVYRVFPVSPYNDSWMRAVTSGYDLWRAGH